MRTRTFVVVGLLAALLVAGVASYWASSHPDGLEHVAEEVGFAETAEDSATAGSPLSDYQVNGVENEALSGGLAGVLGSLVVLVVAGGIAYAVRRRGPVDRAEGTPAARQSAGGPHDASDTHATAGPGRDRG
jgi:cobalt/nickel transport protein